MKRHSFGFAVILFFLIMLFRPQEVFTGASEGLMLWFQIVLPTLLPFIIISNLLVHTSAITYIACILGKFLKHILHISEHGSFAVLTGFLCGYPMGAKVTGDLLNTGYINKNEAGYLLSFCNNTSPMFIMSYVLWQNLGREDLVLPSIAILFLAPILCSFLFCIYHKQNTAALKPSYHHNKSNAISGFQLLDTSIMNGFSTITKVGGYIILFSILITLLKEFPLKSSFWQLCLLPSLEITNGIPLICSNASSFETSYILTLTLTSFGGWCAVAQTKCMIQDSGLSIVPYIIEKLITALVTSLLAILYLYIFK